MAKRSMTEEPVILDTTSLKPNSITTKEKNIKAIVSPDGIIKRKKSLSERFSAMFISEDAGDVKSYLIFDILVPALKDTISDMVRGGIDALLYGNDRPRSSGKYNNSYDAPRVSYQKYYQDGYYDTNRGRSNRSSTSEKPRTTTDFRDIRFQNKGDAIAVLDELVDLTIQYDCVTIMDLNSLLGLDSIFTDNDFGWENLNGAKVRHVRGGYMLDLPNPIPID